MASRKVVAAIIDAHGINARKSYVTAVCSCGWRGTFQDHPNHVADELIAAGVIVTPSP